MENPRRAAVAALIKQEQDGYANLVLRHALDGFTEAERIPNPQRLLKSYHASASALNLIRAFTQGGFADLREVHSWNRGFATNPRSFHGKALAEKFGAP